MLFGTQHTATAKSDISRVFRCLFSTICLSVYDMIQSTNSPSFRVTKANNQRNSSGDSTMATLVYFKLLLILSPSIAAHLYWSHKSSYFLCTFSSLFLTLPIVAEMTNRSPSNTISKRGWIWRWFLIYIGPMSEVYFHEIQTALLLFCCTTRMA
jgi:hypothetical protein